MAAYQQYRLPQWSAVRLVSVHRTLTGRSPDACKSQGYFCGFEPKNFIGVANEINLSH